MKIMFSEMFVELKPTLPIAGYSRSQHILCYRHTYCTFTHFYSNEDLGFESIENYSNNTLLWKMFDCRQLCESFTAGDDIAILKDRMIFTNIVYIPPITIWAKLKLRLNCTHA